MTAAEIVRELREAVAKVPRPLRQLVRPLATDSEAAFARADRDELVERVRLLVETWDGK